MPGFISEDIVEEIRFRADIVQVISEYVHLQRKGKNFVGPCPFHQETNPSFTVTPDKQMFYCFGCNVGGNVFKFIMLQHQVSFPEAVRILGERVGVQVPDGYNPRMREQLRREEKAWKINAWARDYFHQVLLQRPEASDAREYLARRGITSEVIQDFKLGFALPAWDSLIKFMQGKGVTARELVDVGLAVSGNKRTYDRFRSRLMFPITDVRGRVAGFGGRVLGDEQPKYLNTPETDFFNKSEILYGLDRAAQHIRRKGYAIVTEGYMDTIAAHQFGIKNAVASLGTSLTREHGRVLMRYTKEVIIAYDADAAGVSAALRGLDILQELGLRVRVVILPEGKDPDEFLRHRGAGEWERLVAGALPLIEFKLQAALEKYDKTPAGKEAVLEDILPSLAAMQNELEKNEAVRLIASRLFTSYHSIAEELRKFSIGKRKKWTNPDKITKNKHNMINNHGVDFGQKAEYGLLKLILEDINFIDSISSQLPGNFFHDPFCHTVYEHLLHLYGQPNYSPSVLFDYLEDGYQQKLGALLMEPVPGDDREALLTGYIRAIKKRQLLAHRKQLQVALAGAEKNGDQEAVMRILQEINTTDKSLKGGEMVT